MKTIKLLILLVSFVGVNINAQFTKTENKKGFALATGDRNLD